MPPPQATRAALSRWPMAGRSTWPRSATSSPAVRRDRRAADRGRHSRRGPSPLISPHRGRYGRAAARGDRRRGYRCWRDGPVDLGSSVHGAKTADIAPTVSPDGTRLAYFAVTRAPGRGLPPPPQRIIVANVDGTAARAVSPRSGFAADPDWSPDGTRLVYAEARVEVAESTTGRARQRRRHRASAQPDGASLPVPTRSGRQTGRHESPRDLRDAGRWSSIMAMLSPAIAPSDLRIRRRTPTRSPARRLREILFTSSLSPARTSTASTRASSCTRWP